MSFLAGSIATLQFSTSFDRSNRTTWWKQILWPESWLWVLFGPKSTTLDLVLKALDLRFLNSQMMHANCLTEIHVFWPIFAGFTAVGFTVFTLVTSWNVRISHALSLRNELCVGAPTCDLWVGRKWRKSRDKKEKISPQKTCPEVFTWENQDHCRISQGNKTVHLEVPGWSCGWQLLDGLWWVINPSYLFTRPFIGGINSIYKWCLGCIFSFQRGYQLSCAGRASAQISAMGVGGPMVQAGGCEQWVELVGSQLVLLVHEQWKNLVVEGFWGDYITHFHGDYFINHEITVRMKQPQGTGWFFVAHMISPSTFVGPSWVFRSLGASPSSTSKAWQPGRFGARCRYS